MQISFIFVLLLGCTSISSLDPSNNEDTHSTKKISFHQMGLKFSGDVKQINDKQADHLNVLSRKIISTSQPIKKITIFANPDNKDLSPKMELINYDRAESIKRYLERDLHTQGAIEIVEDENSPYQYKKKADILILVEYL